MKTCPTITPPGPYRHGIGPQMKRLRRLLLIALAMACAAAGCYNKKQVQEKPEGLINRNTMVKLIAESYLIESDIHTLPDTAADRGELTRQYYRELFNRYNVTRQQFIASINYYIGEETSAEKLLDDASQLLVTKRHALNLPDTTAPPPPATASE